MTAAVGAEAFYSLANNAARTEGFDMARELDQRCQTAWCGHPALDVIDNASGFDEKMLRLIAVRSASASDPTRPLVYSLHVPVLYFSLLLIAELLAVLKRHCVQAVCQRIGLDTGDRLQSSSSKRKFLLRAFPKESEFAAAVSR